jgi:hypothetical protein
MNTRTLIKNLVVAAALGIVAVATWAVTESQSPAIEASSGISQSA